MAFNFFQPSTFLICSALVLSACGAIPQKSSIAPLPYSERMVSASAPVPTLADIFELTAEQQDEFLQYFHSAELKDTPQHDRVFKFLEQHLQGFHYLGENLTAREAFATKSGNCISLAVLTKALADVAGVPVEFQSIVSAPVYSMESDYMLSSDHVRTFLVDPDFIPEKGMIYFFKPMIVVDYLPAIGDVTGPRISQQTFTAMFYRNLAADAMLAQQYDQALALLNAALHQDPLFGSAINLAAIIHRRLDQAALAEQFYQYGLGVSKRKVTLLGNYAVLKQHEGNLEQAEVLLQALKDQDEHDPYLWFVLGQSAMGKQHYSEAIVYLKKAVAQAPDMHQLQLALALAYYRDNQLEFAHAVLAKAVGLAPQNNIRQRYDAKLHALMLNQRSL